MKVLNILEVFQISDPFHGGMGVAVRMAATRKEKAMYRIVFAVPFLVGFFGCASKAPTGPKPAAHPPTVAFQTIFLREELLVPRGLRGPGSGTILAYARPSLAAKVERLCGKKVYLKYTLGDCVLRDVEERSLLDEIVQKVGNHRKLFASFDGWENYRWCTDVRLDLQKKLLTFRTGDGQERTALFFEERVPEGQAFHITTVTACMDLYHVGALYSGVVGNIFTEGVAHIEAAK